MPQMSPLLWLNLYFYFILIFILMVYMVYFYKFIFNLNFTKKGKFLSVNYKIKW